MKLVVRVFILLAASFFVVRVMAQSTSASVTPMRDRAQQELKNTPSSETKASDVSGALSHEKSEGILRLEDPFEKIPLRNFQWGLGVHLQPYQPRGRITNESFSSQELETTGSTLMPSISLGALYGLAQTDIGFFQGGLEGEVGFMSQKNTVTTITNKSVDGQLNSSLTEARALVRWGKHWTSRWHGRLGAGVGKLSITQSSDNSLARWSKDTTFNSYLVGVDYQLNRSWLAQMNYRTYQKGLGSGDSIQVPTSQLDFGAQVVW
ncbi:MAG: hypothetical protein COT73_10525 [Bdellovibrio sp. CG10_big_fil_rev_8_21_14_0_10_47_8]|nr:MAG: hypothetical protein COT73_10525 [Bdellovibrio sp. CG10_big_fil_rev_8_21_14_0_10_47_8]